MFQEMVRVCSYTDDMVINRNDMFKNNMYILDDVLNLSEKSGIQVNAVKCEWAVI